MRKFIMIFLLSSCAVLTLTAQDSGDGRGSGNGSGDGISTNKNEKNAPMRITLKPRPLYTDSAKAKNVQGTVILKVEFKRDGTIGKISVVSGLPEGLSEQAVKAAGFMRFEPQRKDGKPITITKDVNYTFTLF